jgi:hypothetical protein
MSRMVLGTYTFERDPSSPVPRIEQQLSKSVVDTYDSFESFTWRRTDLYCGIELPLKWNFMSDSMYSSLQTIFLANLPVVFQPGNGDTRQFTVEVIKLTPGDAFFVMGGTGARRANVSMILKIRSLVVTP